MAGWRLLEKFHRLFGFFSRVSSQLAPEAHLKQAADPEPISEDERLSRYVTNKDHLNAARDRLHFRAFLPSSKRQEVSIIRTEQLTEEKVWEIGDRVVAEPAGRIILARGDVMARQVGESHVDDWRLTVVPDEPPPRHALIGGWPPAEESEIRKLLAQQLRAAATLRLKPL